jgi:hypothetical protein
VLGNGPLLVAWASGESLAHADGERSDILGIVRATPFIGTLSSQSTRLGIGQAFLLCPLERPLFNQHTLPLIALAGSAKANHHRT